MKLRRWRRIKRFRRNARSFGGAGPCPVQCIWQGSGFAADQTNAMLAAAVVGPNSISLVSAAADDENSLTPLRLLFPPKPLRCVSAGALFGR